VFGNNMSRRSLKRGRRIGRRRRAGRGSGLRSIDFGPIIKIGGIVVAAAGLILLVVLVIIPAITGGNKSPSTSNSVSPETTVSSAPSVDLASLVTDLPDTPEFVNDPYIYTNGDTTEMVFSTGDDQNPDKIAVYDIKAKKSTEVEGISKKNDALLEPKMNDKYIVYLDCKSKDGGSVCGYDISTKKSFVMREYIWGKPKVSISGIYALWLTQTGLNSDKMYLYNLETKECATLETFSSVNFFVSAPYMSDDKIIYMEPKAESQILSGSSLLEDKVVSIIPLTDKGDTQRIIGSTGTYIYEPMIQGNNIVYLDGVRSKDSHLMYCTVSPNAKTVNPFTLGEINPYDDSGNLTQPVEIAQGVLNYFLGDGFVAYTKDDAVYVYYFGDGTTKTLSESTTRALLCSVSGKDVIWYDTTGGTSDTAAVIKYVRLP
jgi:hypothetical protein